MERGPGTNQVSFELRGDSVSSHTPYTHRPIGVPHQNCPSRRTFLILFVNHEVWRGYLDYMWMDGWMDENVDDYEVALSGAVEYKTEAGQKRLG